MTRHTILLAHEHVSHSGSTRRDHARLALNMLALLGLCISIGISLRACAGDDVNGDAVVPTAEELVTKVFEDEAWLERVDSFLLRIKHAYIRTDEGMKPYEAFGLGGTQTITPKRRSYGTELLLAWDKKRVVVDFLLAGSSRDRRTWDGSLAIASSERFKKEEELARSSYVLGGKPEHIYRSILDAKNVWGCSARRHGPKTWWRPLEKSEPEEVVLPQGLKLAGQETYAGNDCYRVDTLWNRRLYIRVSDQRLMGDVTLMPQLSADDQLQAQSRIAGQTIENFQDWQQWLETLDDEKRREARKTLQEEKNKTAIVGFERRFDDYREVAPGCWFPYAIRSMKYRTDSGSSILTLEIQADVEDVQVGIALPHDLFTQEIADGSNVTTDWRYDPPLRYTYRADQTEEERQELAATKRAEREEAEKFWDKHKANVDRQLGKQPPRIDKNVWIGSEPLTWADLKGKAVALVFWDIGCGPCHSTLDFMQRIYPGAAERRQAIIAVHRNTDDVLEVKKHMDEQGWTFPVLIDGDGESDSTPSLFEWSGIEAMPWMALIDQYGTFAAHDHPGLGGEIFGKLAAKKPVKKP